MPGQPSPWLGLAALPLLQQIAAANGAGSFPSLCILVLMIFQEITFNVLGKGNGAIAGSSVRGMEPLPPAQPPSIRDGAAPSAFQIGSAAMCFNERL